MSSILISKPKLPDGWIDWAVGEAHVVRDKFLDTFGFNQLPYKACPQSCSYPVATGYEPLVKLLEDKHQAPVIITNGAKQALGASFYALRKLIGCNRLGMRSPYWALIPPIAAAHGLKCNLNNEVGYDCYLSIAPNNPDGYISANYESIATIAEKHKSIGVPFVHDAAYYTSVYLPDDFVLGPVGDMQIFSVSKMYGLSGLRLGYIVVHNSDYYKVLQEYIEMMTVGVSMPSQIIFHEMLSEVVAKPELERRFVVESRDALYKAKFLTRLLPKDVLGVPDHVEHIPGVFGWFDVGPKCDFKKARIHTVDGEMFGDARKVRLNLGLQTDALTEAINRMREQA